MCRSLWPRGLRHELSSPARTLGSWVRIPLEPWMPVCVYSVCAVLCGGRGLVTRWSPVQGVLRTAYKKGKCRVKLSLCLTNLALRHGGIWRSGCIDPFFLDLDTSWRWVVSFTSLPLSRREKSPRYSFAKKLGAPQSRSGRRGNGKILDLTGARTQTPLSSSP
jgi:hypothetical protein